MDIITCPHCKRSFELSQAIINHLAESIRADEKKKRDEEVEKARQQAKKEMIDENKTSQNKLLEEQRKRKLLEDKLALSEKEKKENEDKIKQQAEKDASDKFRLERLEYEKRITDMQKSVEEARRKGKQGSQQLQGEVLELDLEEKLKLSFPYDEFKPVAKGKEGADLVQYVKNKYGKIGSVILWEFKRTKNWDGKKWLPKLRENQRNINANEAIIVSETLPDNINVYEKVEGIWITSRKYAIYLAKIVREMGLRIAIAKSGAQHTDENLKKLHEYILSEKFRHKIDRHREQTEKAIQILENRKRSDERYYRDQKILLDILANNTPQIYFDLQEILPSLPSITNVEPELVSEDSETLT